MNKSFPSILPGRIPFCIRRWKMLWVDTSEFWMLICRGAAFDILSILMEYGSNRSWNVQKRGGEMIET